MGEVRISDKMLNDPRMLRLGGRPNARLLYWEAYMWADREGSEGILDDVVIPGLCRGFEREQQPAVDALVSVGLWVRRDSGYYVVGYMESGKASRAARLAREQQIRDARVEAGRKGAEERERLRREASALAKTEQIPSKPYSEQANGKQPIDTESELDGEIVPHPADSGVEL
jgi:hypothetical protein